MKIVHAHVYNPENSLFKSRKNDRAECQVVTCSNSENCGLFKRGECATIAMLDARNCPYGKKSYEYGFTRKARGFGKWISERKEKYKDALGKLGSYKKKLAIVGDYVFLPYAHMNMNKDLPVSSHGSFMNNGSHFIDIKAFDVNLIMNIIRFRPQALFGGEITSYQKEVVPMFVMHLKEEMPEMYALVVKEHEYVENIIKNFSPVGRKALVHTLRPGTVVTKYHDTTKLSTQHWTWDGEYLSSTDAGMTFAIVNYDECIIKMRPKKGEAVVITSEDQVDENTEYVD